MDWKFRRQQPIGPYIVDFVCFERRLIVEVDGSQHGQTAGRDAARDALLCGRGFVVLRFWDSDVLRETAAVLDKIRAIALLRPPSPSPSPAGAGERDSGIANDQFRASPIDAQFD
jgi:very-short-patch-repair endonuclease